MPSEAKKISDSVSVRDFDSEARTLQEQIAESERRLAAADDEIAAATEATLLRTAAAADAALERGDRAAEGTREKIHEQQERFKAGVVADGLSLDEPVEVLVRQQKVADAGGVNVTGNKYAHLMHTRKLQQEVERQ